MKQYKRLASLFLIIVFFSCILAPIAKVPLDFMLEKTGFMANSVDYENGMYDFGKVMRRVLMLVALIAFIVFRKSLRFGILVSSGLKIRTGFFKQFLLGFLLAGLAILIYYGFGLLTEARVIHLDYDSAGDIIGHLVGYLLIGCLIAIIEEILFRGFVLQSFQESMSVPMSVCICSLIYSLLHFFRSDVIVSTGFQPFVGFVTIAQFFKPLFFEFLNNLSGIIGLFMLGVVLSYAFVKTKTLYFSIGFHASCVFMMKADGMFLGRDSEKMKWLFGGSELINGVLTWFFLICAFFIIRKVYSDTVNANHEKNILRG